MLTTTALATARETAPLASMVERGHTKVLKVRDIVDSPMPHKAGRPLARGVIRGLLLAFGGCIVRVRGLERIAPEHDPFILALNHSTKLEALFLPAFLLHQRAGTPLHFIADWNLKLVPGIACIYRAGDVITLDRKPARPRFLNALRPLLTDRVPAFTRAAERLVAGASVGIFPEGTTNRDRAGCCAASTVRRSCRCSAACQSSPPACAFRSIKARRASRNLRRWILNLAHRLCRPPSAT